MKKIFKYLLYALIAPVLICNIGNAQTSSLKEANAEVFIGDTLILRLQDYVGEIVQWQESQDGETWTDISGATNDSLWFEADQTTYFRASVTAGDCEPFYSDTIHIRVIHPLVGLLAGETSKTWKLYRVGPSMGVGPDLEHPTAWWYLENDGSRPCKYFWEYTFTRDMEYIFNDNGSFWAEFGVWGGVSGQDDTPQYAEGCFAAIPENMFNVFGDDVSAWLSGTHQFEYDPSTNTVTLIGEGAWIGLCKVGTDGEYTVPQNSVTFQIEITEHDGYDHMYVKFVYDWGVWVFNYASYSDPSLEPDVVEASVPFEELLAGETSKTWKLYRVGPSMGVGPDLEHPTSWWYLENDGTRPCVYFHEFTFTRNMVYIFDDKGFIWADDWLFHEDLAGACIEAIPSNMIGPDGEDLSAWLGGIHSYDYNPNTNIITLNGLGAWIGLMHVGTDGDNYLPQTSVSFNAEIEERDGYDYMHVWFQYDSYVWSFYYAHYYDPSLEPDVVEASVPFEELLAGETSKTWKLYRVGPSMGVGPDLENPTAWWYLENDGTRPCVYFHEFTFTRNMEYIFDDKGFFWSEGITDPPMCMEALPENMVNMDGIDVSAWLSGTHQFEYDPSTNTVTLIGEGAWIGLPKLATDGEVTVPQNSVSFQIEITEYDGYDYMHVWFQYDSYVWSFYYAHYYDPSLEPDVVEDQGSWGEDLPNITPEEIFITFAARDAENMATIDTVASGSTVIFGVDDPLDAEAQKVGQFIRTGGIQWQELQFRTSPVLYDIQFDNFTTASIDIYIPDNTNFSDGGLQRFFVFGFADMSETQYWWESPVQYAVAGDDVVLGAWHTYTFDLTEVKERDDLDMIFLGIGGGGHIQAGIFYVRNLIFE